VKSCAPFCTINCVHQTSILDSLRENPRETIVQLLGPEPPAPVRALSWAFLNSNKRGAFARAALWLLGIE
jgi:hypothetical protein